MKNISMFIRGAIGIKKGLGRDEIEFDLKNKTGLVALAGPNGKGKSTVLELMSLYRTLASRKGSLKHHFFLRDSRVEHKFIYDGDEYHLIWKIDSGSDKSEAFILINGESVVNGKNTEYDKYINDEFGSQTLFYNSVFCAQGSGNLSTMTTGKIKELFVEFLQIERLAEYEKQCKSGVAYHHKKLDILSGKIETCHYELMKLQSINEEITVSDIVISNNSLLVNDVEKKIKQYDAAINKLNIKAEKQNIDIVRKKELESELEKLKHDRDEIKTKIDTEEKIFQKKKVDFDIELTEVVSVLFDKEKILKASSRIKNLGRWEKYFSDCFECSIDEQDQFDKDIKIMDVSIDTITKQIASMNDDPILDGLKTTLDSLEKRKFDFDSNHSILNSKLKSAQNDFSLMQASRDVAECKEKISLSIDPDCTSTICPALGMVAKAKETLPILEKTEADIRERNDISIKEIETAIKIVDASLIDVDARIGDCSSDYEKYDSKLKKESLKLLSEIKTFETTREQLFSDYLVVDDFKGFYKLKLVDTRALIADLKDLSSKKSQIEIAEEKKLSIEKQTKQLEEDYVVREKDHDVNFYNASSDIILKKESISKIDDSIDLNISTKITETEVSKAFSTAEKLKYLEKIDKLKEDAAVLKSDKLRKEAISKDLESKQSDEKNIKKELSEWEYLRLACSKTGLQALEIDGAAPLITAEANTLLEKAFGLESQIKIITQDPESGREVFWIKVIREDGSEDDFSNLSGGQRVWISHALRLGMTLVSKHKSGREFKTLYMDESDGALDREKATEFIKLYRSMLNAGGFETCYFISHNPDLIAMADSIIDFAKL